MSTTYSEHMHFRWMADLCSNIALSRKLKASMGTTSATSGVHVPENPPLWPHPQDHWPEQLTVPTHLSFAQSWTGSSRMCTTYPVPGVPMPESLLTTSFVTTCRETSKHWFLPMYLCFTWIWTDCQRMHTIATAHSHFSVWMCSWRYACKDISRSDKECCFPVSKEQVLAWQAFKTYALWIC